MKVICAAIFATGMAMVESAYPCTVEINSIAHQASRAAHIVVGEVLEVDDRIYADPEYPEHNIRIVRSAAFRVERVLKGPLEDETLQLAFAAVDLAELPLIVDCLDYSYKTGDKKLLMLEEAQDDGSYWAPLLRPSVIPLTSEDFQGSALDEYVSYVVEHGTRPVELLFEGADEYVVGQPIELTITVTNRMGVEISAVATPSAYVPPAESRALLSLRLYQTSDHYFTESANPPERAAFVSVPSGQTRAFDVRLDAYYVLPVGSYGLAGDFFLGSTSQAGAQEVEDESVFRDHWANFGPEFFFRVREGPTAIESGSWGQLKEQVGEQ